MAPSSAFDTFTFKIEPSRRKSPSSKLSHNCGFTVPLPQPCPKGTYDPLNPNYQFILWEIGARYKWLYEDEAPNKQEYQEELAERSVVWHDLKAGIIPEKRKDQKKRKAKNL